MTESSSDYEAWNQKKKLMNFF